MSTTTKLYVLLDYQTEDISAFGIQWPSRSKTYLIEWWETEENQTTLSTINQMNQCLMCKVQFHILINIYYITDILVIIHLRYIYLKWD